MSPNWEESDRNDRDDAIAKDFKTSIIKHEHIDKRNVGKKKKKETNGIIIA